MSCNTCTADEFLAAIARSEPKLASATLFVYHEALLLVDAQKSVETYSTSAYRKEFIQRCRATYSRNTQNDCFDSVFEDLARILPEFIACLGSGAGFFGCVIVLLPVVIRLVLCLISNRSLPDGQIDMGKVFSCAIASIDFSDFIPKLINCLTDGGGGGNGGGGIPWTPNQTSRC